MTKKKESFSIKIKNRLIKISKFITHELWSIHLDDLPPKLKLPFKYLRVAILALRGFTEDKVAIKASALTYYTLMSIVPIFAMAFGIAKGFGFEKYLENQIKINFQGQEEVMNHVIDFANSLLQRTGGGIIAGIGVIVLFWSVIKVLSSIENAFNDIWQVEKPRPYIRKLTDYLTIMIIAPILLLASGSVQIYLATKLNTIAEEYAVFGYLTPVLNEVFRFLPFIFIWTLFSIIFIAMPNTRVSPASGIIAGIISGTGFLIIQWAYIGLQIGVSKYNAIYGSFAALPLFLVWLQTSWLIVLFGAEVSFAYQNVDMYEFEQETKFISPYHQKLLSILILSTVVKRFINGEKPLTSLELSKGLKLPQRLMRHLLTLMVDCNLLNEVISDEPRNPAYQPAIDVNKLSLDFVEGKLDNHGHSIEPDIPETKKIKHVLDTFHKEYQGITKNTYVGEL
ncbi:MAG TPA: YihY/virulence factor BrkB family protein [Tenuifilaceae bacterium]|nr:YihY/virulence factor BrkB family protein [Tenuifilaceae bacterium]